MDQQPGPTNIFFRDRALAFKNEIKYSFKFKAFRKALEKFRNFMLKKGEKRFVYWTYVNIDFYKYLLSYNNPYQWLHTHDLEFLYRTMFRCHFVKNN